MIDGSKIWLLLWNTETREFQYETLNEFCDNNMVSRLNVFKSHPKSHRPLVAIGFRESKGALETLSLFPKKENFY